MAKTKMIVMPASRMLSAISLGVFWREAPSTSAIMRSMKVEPAAAVMRTRIQSDSTCVPPVTAERSPPDSRITGADSPVMAASLTEAMPSITSPSEGMMSPASTSTTSPTASVLPGTVSKSVRLLPRRRLATVSVRVRRRRVGLRLAAPLGHRLGEVGEEHGEPQPDDDLRGEAEVRRVGDEIAHEEHGDERRHHLDDEHDRVGPERAGIELAERAADRGDDQRGIEDGGGGTGHGNVRSGEGRICKESAPSFSPCGRRCRGEAVTDEGSGGLSGNVARPLIRPRCAGPPSPARGEGSNFC